MTFASIAQLAEHAPRKRTCLVSGVGLPVPLKLPRETGAYASRVHTTPYGEPYKEPISLFSVFVYILFSLSVGLTSECSKCLLFWLGFVNFRATCHDPL